jgi:hypothetical protein
LVEEIMIAYQFSSADKQTAAAQAKRGTMRISTKAMALASALLWGGGVAFTALVHLAYPTYGSAFLGFVSSIYPGFHGARSPGDALVGIAYGVVDGAAGGFIFASLYNLFAGRMSDPGVNI